MRSLMTVSGVLAAALFAAIPARASSFTVTNLVSDELGVGAITDPNLVNAWGIATSATSPFWIGSNGTGLSTIYNGGGSKLALEVHIPGDGSVTGVVFNGGVGFNNDVFLFASEDGTVSGWRGALGTSAENLQLASPDAVYKGLAVGTLGGYSYSYLANFRTGVVDVLKGDNKAPGLAATSRIRTSLPGTRRSTSRTSPEYSTSRTRCKARESTMRPAPATESSTDSI
jgi:uncharacterized protein (TIGR03118 family)